MFESQQPYTRDITLAIQLVIDTELVNWLAVGVCLRVPCCTDLEVSVRDPELAKNAYAKPHSSIP